VDEHNSIINHKCIHFYGRSAQDYVLVLLERDPSETRTHQIYTIGINIGAIKSHLGYAALFARAYKFFSIYKPNDGRQYREALDILQDALRRTNLRMD
jgi:hypothetical protein